jgi:hypothetical protein
VGALSGPRECFVQANLKGSGETRQQIHAAARVELYYHRMKRLTSVAECIGGLFCWMGVVVLSHWRKTTATARWLCLLNPKMIWSDDVTHFQDVAGAIGGKLPPATQSFERS